MKKIYCIALMDDIGELWLDENKCPIEFVHANDGGIDDHHWFIFEHLSVDFVHKEIYIENEGVLNRLWNASGDKDKIFKIMKKEISKL